MILNSKQNILSCLHEGSCQEMSLTTKQGNINVLCLDQNSCGMATLNLQKSYLANINCMNYYSCPDLSSNLFFFCLIFCVCMFGMCQL